MVSALSATDIFQQKNGYSGFMKKIQKYPFSILISSCFLASTFTVAFAQENSAPAAESNVVIPSSNLVSADVLPDPQKLQAGPALPLRQALAKQIVAASKRGVGVKAYIAAFGELEESVSKGASEADVKKKVMSIVSSLHGQLKQSQSLKASGKSAARAASNGTKGGDIKLRSDGFLYAEDNKNIFMKDQGVMRQQAQLDLVEQVIRNKLREHPIRGVNPNDPRPLRDDPRVKHLLH